MPSEQQLLAELEALRAEVASLQKENITLSENQVIQLQIINQLKEEIRKQPAGDNTAQKTKDNLTRIAVILGAKEKRLIEGQAARHYLARYRKEGMTFSEIAALMGLTVESASSPGSRQQIRDSISPGILGERTPKFSSCCDGILYDFRK